MLDITQITARGGKGKYDGHVQVETPDSSDDIRLGIAFGGEDTSSTFLSAEEALEVARALIDAAVRTL